MSDEFPHEDKDRFVDFPWRIGRKVGRTIYAQVGRTIYAQVGSMPSDDDVMIGAVDTPRLAAAAVKAHNHNLLSGRG